MKKYFKFIGTEKNAENYQQKTNPIVGKIYKEECVFAGANVCHWATCSCRETQKEWQEVPESEYLLQQAKEKYPVGTKFIYNDEIRTVIKKPYMIIENMINVRTPAQEWVGTNQDSNPFIYKDGTWAEIISTTNQKEKKELISNHMDDAIDCIEDMRKILNTNQTNKQMKKTTHEEAIKELEDISIANRPSQWKAIKYAIDQLKKFEVFQEKVMMEVSEFEDFSILHCANIVAKTEWGYIGLDEDKDVHVWPYAREIKKEPLSFTEWFKKTFSWKLEESKGDVINKAVNSYKEYLNNFNK